MPTYVPKTPGEQFAVWLAQYQPDMFLRVLKASQGGQLAGLTDVLASIGTGISTAAKAVGSFVTSKEGATAIAGLASVYLTTQAQRSALNTQVQLAQMGQPPAPIAYQSPTSQPVIYAGADAGGLSPVTGIPVASGTFVAPSAAAVLPYTPTAGEQFISRAGVDQLKQYLPWALTFGVLAYLALRR